jgi:Rit1 N-terminal domain
MNRAILAQRSGGGRGQGCSVAQCTSCTGSAAPCSSASPVSSVALPHSGWDTALHVPLFISHSERESMNSRIPAFINALAAVQPGGLPATIAALPKPLRPLWLSQQSHIVANCVTQPEDLPFCPIVLISASCPALYWRRQICIPHMEFAQTEEAADCLRKSDPLCAGGSDSSGLESGNSGDRGRCGSPSCTQARVSSGSYMCVLPTCLLACAC